MRPLIVLMPLCLALPAVAAPIVPTPIATAGMADAPAPPPFRRGNQNASSWTERVAHLRFLMCSPPLRHGEGAGG